MYNYPSKKSKLSLTLGRFLSMRAHKLISKFDLASNMRPINVTLDATTWELAKQKTNFSAWVRNQLRSERNKREEIENTPSIWCVKGCGRVREHNSMFCIECIEYNKKWSSEEE